MQDLYDFEHEIFYNTFWMTNLIYRDKKKTAGAGKEHEFIILEIIRHMRTMV